MIQKIKDFFSGLSGSIIVILGGTIAILTYVMSNRKKETDALKAKIDLVETQKHADLIDVEIKERMFHADALEHEVIELQKAQVSLEQKRQTLPKNEIGKTDKEIEDFWSKK